MVYGLHLVVLEIREPVPVSGEIYGITVKKKEEKKSKRAHDNNLLCVVMLHRVFTDMCVYA